VPGDPAAAGAASAVFRTHPRPVGRWLKLLRDQAAEHLQNLLPVRFRERFPEPRQNQLRARSRRRRKKVPACLRGLVPVLGRCYDGCGTNPPAAEEQRDIRRATTAKVDAGQLRRFYGCSFCNSFKGRNIAGLDPLTKKLTRLVNPRRHKWGRHFRWEGARLLGLTPVGRTTVHVLAMNEPERVELRQELIDQGLL
jgi:hypothetical protein